jgi:acetylornithine deacetylase/succinyl-diaminopimelate desuccinylase-like protein
MPAPDVVDLCRQLVRLPSVGERDGEAAVVAHLQALLATMGTGELKIVEPAPGRPSLVYTLHGRRSGPTLLLNGHADTVLDTPGWSRDPYGAERDGDRVYGLGSSDMKGGVAAIVCATLEVATGSGPDAGTLMLAVTADEDAGMEWGVPWLLANGHLDADVAIVAEAAGATNDFERLALGSRGYGYVEIEVSAPGRAHASRYSRAQPHAVAIAADLIGAIERDFRPTPREHPLYPEGPTVVAGYEFHGGEALGRLAEHARFSVGVRLLPGGDGVTLMDELSEFVGGRAGGAEVSITPVAVSPFAEGMALGSDHPLARLASDAVVAAGYPAPVIAGTSGFSEGAFFAAHGIPTLPALGPGRSPLAHGPDEWVSVSALQSAVSIYRELIAAILCEGSPIPARRV